MIMKIIKLITVLMISAALTACGSEDSASSAAEARTIIEADGKIIVGKEEITAGEEIAAKEEVSTEEVPIAERGNEVQQTETEEIKETAAGEEKPEDSVKSQAEQNESGVYEDNFAVEADAAVAFADKIKVAVAAKDIETLADLTAFPVYVGIAEGGVETREAFIALGAEKVFTPGLMESVGGADTSNLSPSMAGFSISKDGKSNIIFGVVEGRLAISGINYE